MIKGLAHHKFYCALRYSQGLGDGPKRKDRVLFGAKFGDERMPSRV